MNEIAKTDKNYVPVALGVTADASQFVTMLKTNVAGDALLVEVTNPGGGWTPSSTTVLNGIGTDGTAIFLGAPLDRNTYISNSVASGPFLGYGFAIQSAIAGGYYSEIGIIPTVGSGLYDTAGMRTYAPSPTENTYMQFGLTGNSIQIYGQNPDIVDYSSTVSGTTTPDNESLSWYQTYFSSGVPTYNYNGYFQRNASSILTQYTETVSGQSAENFDSYNSFYKSMMGMSVINAYYNYTDNLIFTDYQSTRNYTNAAPSLNQRGSTNPAFVKHEIPNTGNLSFDTGEYYRSQRVMSIYDADPNGDPFYVYDSGTQSGTYTIQNFDNIAVDPMWDNILHINMDVMITNSFGEYGNTEYITIVLPDCSDQFTFGRELTLVFSPCTNVESQAYQKEFRIVSAGGGQTVGGLDIYPIPTQQRVSLTLKGGNNPTIWNVVEGFSGTRFAGRVKTLEEDFSSQVGTDSPLVGTVSGLPLEYYFAPYTFSTDGDRAYGKFFVEFSNSVTDKEITFLFNGDQTTPQYIGARTLVPAARTSAVYELEIVRMSEDNFYVTVSGSYENNNAILNNCSYVHLRSNQPVNGYIQLGFGSTTTTTSNEIIIKQGSFINFEPGITPAA